MVYPGEEDSEKIEEKKEDQTKEAHDADSTTSEGEQDADDKRTIKESWRRLYTIAEELEENTGDDPNDDDYDDKDWKRK